MTKLVPLRIGIAGFGRLARVYYMPGLRVLAGVRVVAVADPLAESRAAARDRLEAVEVYEDHGAMLQRARLDALLVASPPSTHLRIWRDAAMQGLPVFMEKPFVLSWQLDEAERAEPLGRLMVDFNRRFWPAYRRMADLVRNGCIGTPVQAEFRLHVNLLPWCSVTRHRLSADEGGVLHDLGSQALDLMMEAVGAEPESVSAEVSSRRLPWDHVRLRLAFASGLVATCDLGYADRTREALVIEGTRGQLRLLDSNMTIRLERDGAPRARLVPFCLDGAALVYKALRPARAMARFSIGAALSAFIDALRAETPFQPGFEEALRNARWVAAAARSAEEGRAVSPSDGSQRTPP